MSPGAPNDARLVVSNTLGLLFSYGAAQGVQAVTSVVVARRLGPELFGIVNIGLTLALILQTVASFGLPLYLLREVAHAPARAWQLTDSSLALRAGLSVMLSACCAAGLWIFGVHTNFLTFALFLLAGALLAGDVTHLFDAFGVARFQGYLLTLRWGAYAILLFAGLSTRLLRADILVGLAYVLSSAIYLLAQWVLAHRVVKRTTPLRLDVDRALVRAAWPFFVSNVAANVYVRSDILLLGVFRTAREVGFYTAAYQIVFALWGVMSLFQRTQFPITCRRAAVAAGFEEWTVQMLKVGLATTLPLCLACGIWSGPLFERLYGSAYAPSVLPFRILLGQLVSVGSFFIARHVLIAIGKDKAYQHTAVAGALLNLGANFAAIPFFGMIGAACTTILAELATLVLAFRYLGRHLARAFTGPIYRALAATLACGALMTAAALADIPLPWQITVFLAYTAWLVRQADLHGFVRAALRQTP